MNLVFGEQTVDKAALVPSTLRRSPRKQNSSSKSVPSHSTRPSKKKKVFANCEVAEINFLPSEKENMDSNTTPVINVLSVRLSQVDIKMLSSTSSDAKESCSLLCYDEVIQKIPPLLASLWSLKFFLPETEVSFNQHPHQIKFSWSVQFETNLPSHRLVKLRQVLGSSEKKYSVFFCIYHYNIVLCWTQNNNKKTGCEFYASECACWWVYLQYPNLLLWTSEELQWQTEQSTCRFCFCCCLLTHCA